MFYPMKGNIMKKGGKLFVHSLFSDLCLRTVIPKNWRQLYTYLFQVSHASDVGRIFFFPMSFHIQSEIRKKTERGRWLLQKFFVCLFWGGEWKFPLYVLGNILGIHKILDSGFKTGKIFHNSNVCWMPEKWGK